VFEVAIPCEVFGLARPDWIKPWYEFTVCASGDVPFGSWFRTDTAHGLDELVDADTAIVPARHSLDVDPPADLVDPITAARFSSRTSRFPAAMSPWNLGRLVWASSGVDGGE